MPIIVPNTAYFTVAEARTLKPLDNTATYPDANIDATRQIAEQALEDACGVAFVPREQTEILSGNGTNYLLPSRPKAQTVTAVTVAGTVYAGTDLTNLTVDEGGRIYNPLIWTQGTQGNITITYTHGYTTIPLRVKRAAMYLTRRWLVDGPFDERATSMTTDDGTFSLITPGVRGVLFDLPEVNAVIEQYGYVEGVA